MTSPVSAALLAELANTVRRHGLVAWMDRHGHYTAFVDDLIRQHAAGELAFPVLAYRGSFLELMLGLERYGNGLDRDALLIHLPGYETNNVRHTPVLEQYEAAHPFRKALETLVVEAAAGRVRPEEIKRFAATPGLTLAQADAWLAGHTSGPRTGVGQRLAALDPKQVVDGLLGEDRALLRELAPHDLPELAAHLERTVGLDAPWRAFFGVAETSAHSARDLESLVTALAGWLLSVEFVHDLKREPHSPELRPLKRLPKPFVEQSVALARHFRERHPKTYAPASDETEQRIPADALGSHASELGKIDTFRFEEERIREAAVAAAREGRWGEALTWAEQREGVAFWLDASPPKRWTWDLVLYAAKLGVEIEKSGGLVGPRATLADAVEAYTEKGHLVDLAHRRFEQRHHDIMSGDVHGRDGLLAVIHAARRAYRDWADELARAFSRACQANGYLPDESLQQRTIYDRVVAPLVSDGGKAAVFLVDAFRYEMAAELKRELEGPGVTVDLKVALAELPTVTSVGMNVLAAVNQGQRLVPVLSDGDIDGFRTNEFQVRTRDHRARAMGDRADRKAPRQLDLETINRLSTSDLRAIVARAPALIVVHSRELDDGGEAGFGAATFERSLRQLRAAWNQLSQAG
ncbi:MAG: BREX-6 system phosphatase PglZ [Myxococcales bacterium]|nr:BREX-6 system phosphatase PglZ [Myxococcales bacterium]